MVIQLIEFTFRPITLVLAYCKFAQRFTLVFWNLCGFIMSVNISRRRLLQQSLVASGAVVSLNAFSVSFESMKAQSHSAESLATNEMYWQEVSQFYKKVTQVANLEQGYWGKMSLPVEQHYIELTQMVNHQLSHYARKRFGADIKQCVASVAQSLGVNEAEIALTRNATEAMHNLLFQYKGLQSGDGILWADIDYPAYKRTLASMAQEQGLTGKELVLPSTASQAELIEAYRSAIENTPKLKLMILTHASNQHGLVLPVKEIAAIAKKHNVDVICDCAQSWGLLDFTLPELGVDWAVFNLHKWIGTPVGVGALYMKRGTLSKVKPYPGESDPDNSRIYTRIHMATSNFAAFLAIPAALAFHEQVGPKAKMERLKYLRQRWVKPALKMPHIEVLGALEAQHSCGMGAFRVRSQHSRKQVMALQKRLETDFGVFTVARHDLHSGSCIRVTPQVFTSLAEIDQLTHALGMLKA